MTPLFCSLRQKDRTSLDLQPVTHRHENERCLLRGTTLALPACKPTVPCEGEGCWFGEGMFEVTLIQTREAFIAQTLSALLFWGLECVSSGGFQGWRNCSALLLIETSFYNHGRSWWDGSWGGGGRGLLCSDSGLGKKLCLGLPGIVKGRFQLGGWSGKQGCLASLLPGR